MAHEIGLLDSMVSYGGVEPWHIRDTREQTRVIASPGTTVDQLIADSRTGWSVAMDAVYLANGSLVEGHKAIVRSDTGRALHVHSDQYAPLQNSQLAHAIDPLVSAGFAIPETGGSLRDGATVWYQFKLDWRSEVVPGDVIELYAYLSNAHDGSRAASLALTNQRIVCANTLRVADAKGRCAFRSRHLAGALTVWKRDVAEWATELRRKADEHLALCKLLAARPMNQAERLAWLGEFLPMPEKMDTPQARAAATRTQSVIDEIERLSAHGKGVEIDGVMGTAWGALNAVTEYVDHYKFASDDAEKREYGIAFGTGAAMKEKALETIWSYVAS